MLIKAKTLTGYKLDCLDGLIGEIKEFYFDDHYWTIRYVVAETGNWLSDRQVLVSPYALEDVIRENKHIKVKLTKKQIENSPSWKSDKPISNQFEEYYFKYYEWPRYWSGTNMWGFFPYPMRDAGYLDKSTQSGKEWDNHLRSTDNVYGYYIQGIDGEIGHVNDFIIDDETWAIRYMVVSTRNWWPGKKVLVSPQWIERVSWEESKVFVNLYSETIQQSPEYTEDLLLTHEYETELHEHYDRQGYWVEELEAKGSEIGKRHNEEYLC